MLKHQRIAKSCLEIQKKFEEPKEDIDILDPDDLKIVKRNDGYVNLTLLCQSGNEQYKRWIRMTRVTQIFLPNLSIKLKKPKSELIKQGGTQTWGHADIAPDIIKWMTDLRRKRIAKAPQQVNTEEEESGDEDEEVFESVGAPSTIPNTETPLVVVEPESENEEILSEISQLPLIINYKQPLVLNSIEITTRSDDGYINLTALCRAGNKEFKAWYKNKKTDAFLKVLSSSVRILTDELLKYETGSNENRATWGHPQVAINIAQWISPEFDVQVSKWIFELMLTGRVELGKEKTNAELEDIFETQRVSLDYQHHLGKDVLYFFEFIPDRNGLEDPTLLDNKELHFFEFGFTSNIQQRTSSSDYPRPNYRLDKLFVYDSGFKTSLAEKYTKNICYDLGLKIDYFKKKECLKATYKDLEKLYDLISKHVIRSQEDNDMCKYEIEKMRLEYEIMKLSLLEKGVLTYEQFKDLGVPHKI